MSKSLTAKWYDQNAETEHRRLMDNPLEFAISMRAIMETIEKYPNPQNLEILDLGGGTGRYAVKLAKLGHRVTLVDISQSELDIASTHAQASNVSLTDMICTDARDIQKHPQIFRKRHFDLVLCQGPMYHILEEQDRINVLRACKYVTKPSGYILVAFVTRFAHLRDLAVKDPRRLIREEEFYNRYLQNGMYIRNPQIQSHHVLSTDISALYERVNAADSSIEVERHLVVERMIACESFLGGGLSSGLRNLEQEEFEKWVDLAWKFCENTDVGTADHLLAVSKLVDDRI